MHSPGYFLISEEFVDELHEKEWNALFDGLKPNEITGQSRLPERDMIKIELEGPDVEPGTEYKMAFTYEDDGTVSASLDTVKHEDRTLQLVA